MRFDQPFLIDGRLTVFYRAFAVGIAGLYDNARTYECHDEKDRLRLDSSMFLSVANAIGGADPDFMEACSLLSEEYKASIRTMGTIYGRRHLLSSAVNSATRVVGAESLSAELISDLCLTDHNPGTHTMGMIGIPEMIPKMIAIGIDAGISPISRSASTSRDHLLYIAAKCLESGIDRSGVSKIQNISNEWLIAMRMCCLPKHEAISDLANALRRALIRYKYGSIWKLIEIAAPEYELEAAIGKAASMTRDQSAQQALTAAATLMPVLYSDEWVPSSAIFRLTRYANSSSAMLRVTEKIGNDPRELLLDRLGTRLVR